MNISKLVSTKAVKACFPFHDEQRRSNLAEGWIKTYAHPGAQPLQEIKARVEKSRRMSAPPPTPPSDTPSHIFFFVFPIYLLDCLRTGWDGMGRAARVLSPQPNGTLSSSFPL